MSWSEVFVAIFAVVSVAVSMLAIWRISRAPGVKYKPFWIGGSLFGFVGVATVFGQAGDLYVQVGIQIPVLMWTSGSGDGVLKALFPIVAAIALVKFHGARSVADAAKFD